MIRIILKGRIPSKKNSKIRTGRILISSKEYRAWEIGCKKQLKDQVIPNDKLNRPLHITYKLYFPDARKTDLSNKIESINDLFVDYWLLEDDNHNIIKHMDIESMGIDKLNPRAEITIRFLNTNE